MNYDPQPGEWKCCYHTSIDKETGICRDCGARAAIKLEDPPVKDISFAVEEFEAACDLAIERIGGPNAYNILGQRRERADIISKLQPKKQYGEMNQAGMAGQLASQAYMAERQARLDAHAREAARHAEEEKAREEAERIGSIKALNKEFF